MKPNLHLYIVLFLFAWGMQAQDNKSDTARLFYRHFTVQDGLPSNEVYFGYQDRRGYNWFCTDNGVSRFDGVQFRNYGTAEGLRSNVIFGCREDAAGSLWLYSFAGELYRYQPATDKFESPPFNDSLSFLLGGRTILNLVFERDTVYVVTLGAYARLMYKPGRPACIKLVEGDPQTLAARLLGNGEVVAINSTEENVTRFNFMISGAGVRADTIWNIPINGLVQNHMSSLRAGDDLYIVFGENLLSYNLRHKTHNMEILPFSHIPGLKNSGVGMLSGSYGKGLWALSRQENRTVYQQLIRNRNISGSFEDRQGGIWACSQTDGIYFIPSRTAFSFPESRQEASRRVTSLFTSGDSAFYMTYSGALFLLCVKDQPVQKKLIEPGLYNMRTMMPLNKDEVLLFAAGRNMKYTISTGAVTSATTFEMCRGNRLIAEHTVLARRDKLLLRECAGTWIREKILQDNWKYGHVFSEAFGGDGNMWLATINDLIYMEPGRITEIGKAKGLSKFSVKQMMRLGGDTLLAASNHGVYLIVKNEIRKSITEAGGLSDNNVHTLFLEGNELWVGTSTGIDRITDFRSGAGAKVSSVTGLTGIPRCPVTHLGSIGSYLVAGTDEGVYLFDKKHIFYKPVQVTPLIAGLVVNGSVRITDVSAPLELKHDQNSLVIEFNALNHRNAMQNKYKYRLRSNAYTPWSYTTQNHIVFTLLSPGTYAFELQAMNPDGSWSSRTSSLTLTINKPFWLTWWFILLLIVGSGGLVYVLFRLRIRQMQQVGDLTGKLSEAKMQALGMQLSPHFVFNALNSVSSHIARNDAKSTLKVLGKFAKLMRLVFRNSQHAIIPLKDELEALDLYIELEAMRLGKEFRYTIDIDSVNVSECKVPALLLQPFVENAIWHGIGPLAEEGKLELIFMRIGDTLQIEIIDNGVGRYHAARIKPKSDKRIHSLDIIKERLELLKTKYNSYTHVELTNAFEDRDFCGTKVLLIIPWLSDSETRGRNRILKQLMLDDQSAYN